MMPEDILMAYKYDLPENMSGYWGSVGIRVKGGDDYFWYPITSTAKSDLEKGIHNEVIAIPCMNNRVLVLNMKNINEVILLDDACDRPGTDSWSSPINHEDVPQAVYDALYDLPTFSGEHMRQDVSPILQDLTQQVIKELGWDEDILFHLLYRTIIHFADGYSIEKSVSYYYDANSISGLDELIFSVYMMDADQDQINRIIEIEDNGGERSFINLDNVSFFDIPGRSSQYFVQSMKRYARWMTIEAAFGKSKHGEAYISMECGGRADKGGNEYENSILARNSSTCSMSVWPMWRWSRLEKRAWGLNLS